MENRECKLQVASCNSPFSEPASRRERVLLSIAAAFVTLGAITLHFTYPPFDLHNLSFLIFSFFISFAAAHVTLTRRLPKRDPLLLPTAALLSGWGLLMVGRVAPNFLARQSTWLMLSALAMLTIAQTGQGLRWLRRFRYTWLLVGLALLATTILLGVNPSGYGPRLWLSLGGVYFQPSEPLKLLMIIYLASYLAERRELLMSKGWKIWRWHLPPLAYAGPLLVMFGLAVLLLAWQQDLGTAMLFFFTFLGMLYLATGEWGYVVAGLALFLLAGATGYTQSTRLAMRVEGWLDPWRAAADQSFQIVQSLLAFGEGGILGQGLGLGSPTYIPAVHTDFVFAAIGEAFGLSGTLAVIALYAIIMARGFRTAARAHRPFERFLAAGLTAGLAIQAWVIIAANTKLAPIAGVTLPFLSYGGSSLLSTFIALGLLLRISNLRSPTSNIQSPVSNLQSPILHLAYAIGLALALLGFACGYWSVVRADWLVARADNPRRVAYERRIIRGRILGRNGTVLADVEVAPSGIVTRTYPVPEAAPVLGYVSLRYGTAGIEAAFDEVLRGEAHRSTWEAAWADLLHRPPRGRDVQLTLDAALQRAAQEALAGESGAAVLLDARSGEVLAMASTPIFDPAHLDGNWEQLREDPDAPLVNRATQGLYQPGAAFHTIVLAEALVKTGGWKEVALSDSFPNATETVPVDGASVGCSFPPADGVEVTLGDAYAAACPAPIAALGEQLGAAGLAGAVERWAFTTPPPLEIPTEANEQALQLLNDPSGALSTTAELRQEAIGQGQLTVSPLQMALVAATLVNEGKMPAPHLALLTGGEGEWGMETGEPRSILPAEEAGDLLAAWAQYGEDSDKVAGNWGFAISGAGNPHAWFIGAAPLKGEKRFAVAVLIERAADPEKARDVGLDLLQMAIQ
jgi:cell division protein FtsW (lipid II flippase)